LVLWLVSGFILALAVIFTFGYWKGEKPRWQWGLPKEKDKLPKL
jgi:hypothetical protein